MLTLVFNTIIIIICSDSRSREDFCFSLKGRNFSMSVKKGRVGERKSTGVPTEGASVLKRRECGQEAVPWGHLYPCGDGQAHA